MNWPATRFRLHTLALALIGFMGLTDASAQDEVPRFEPTDCHFETEEPLEGVDCGELVVWENRERHEEGTLRLAVASLRSTGETPEPDPLVFIPGGPGNRSVFYTPSRVSGEFWQQLRTSRDLIFYDQRGTGYSDPEFCDELDRVFYATRYLGLSMEEVVARRVEAARPCREKMRAKGVDLSTYNSETSARDLDDLRRALGYERWNLLGLSYGTRLALTAMRETPSGIRSVILDSTSPPNARGWVDTPRKFARSLGLVFEQCAADETCSRAFPDLEDRFYAWLDSLEASPVELRMEDTTRFPDGRFVVDGSLAAGGVFAGLYDRRFIPLLPLLVREGGPRAEHVWRALADRLADPPEQNSRGQHFSVECYEAAPFNPPAMIDSARARRPELYVSTIIDRRDYHPVCDAWHGARADSTFFEPVRSDVSALILAGEFDPITPPDYGRLAAETLSNSTVVEAPGLGHGVGPYTGCTRDLVAAFLEEPRRDLDTSCVSEIPPVSFVTDVHVSRGVYPIARSIQQGPGIPVLAGIGLVGLVLLSGILGWPLGALVSRFRGGPSVTASGLQRTSRWAAALAALLSLGFLAGVLYAIRHAVSVNPFLLVFGVPGEFGWLFLLPWGVLALTVVVVLAAIESWRKRWWHVGHRIHYSLVAAGCAAFLAFAAWQGFM